MGKRVCIIGGTGFVGRAVAQQCLDAGYAVTVTTRHPARARDLLIKGIRIIKIDITTGKGLSDAVQHCDCVINLVGLLFESGKNTFAAAHQQGADHVIQACQAAHVPQLLHMSALLDQESAQHSQYASSKIAAEQAVQSSGLQWSIFRPSLIFGAKDSFLMRFKNLSTFGPFLPVIAGNTRFQPIWVDDVARAFVLSINNKLTHQQTYTLAGSEVYSFKELLTLWMSALGRCRLLLAVPHVAATFLSLVSKLLPTPLLTSDQLKLLQFDNIAQGQAFPALFGQTTPFASLLPKLAKDNQSQYLQHQLDDARTRYRQS
ncbi:MAG: complex I NDUFA9 subunit family protein [Mariprofundaceae bacterium]|nr:complex I NDUFA9 subunit family protein [Mariprofundaceae bacterium]